MPKNTNIPKKVLRKTQPFNDNTVDEYDKHSYYLSGEWQLSLDDYNKGGWGMLQGLFFKLPRQTLVEFKNENGDYEVSRIFYESCELIISHISSLYPVLEQIGFQNLQFETRLHLRRAVYRAIQHNWSNDRLLELISGKEYNTPNYTYTQAQANNWSDVEEVLGRHALSELNSSGIQHYEIPQIINEVQEILPTGIIKVVSVGKDWDYE